MDWSPHELINPVSDNVDPVSGTARTNAYQRGNAQQWERAQQSQRRRMLLHRLGQALAASDISEAQQLLAALGEDDFFAGSLISAGFSRLEKAVASGDFPTANQALSHLLGLDREAPGPASQSKTNDDLREVLSSKDESDPHGNLDVTA